MHILFLICLCKIRVYTADNPFVPGHSNQEYTPTTQNPQNLFWFKNLILSYSWIYTFILLEPRRAFFSTRKYLKWYATVTFCGWQVKHQKSLVQWTRWNFWNKVESWRKVGYCILSLSTKALEVSVRVWSQGVRSFHVSRPQSDEYTIWDYIHNTWITWLSIELALKFLFAFWEENLKIGLEYSFPTLSSEEGKAWEPLSNY